MANHALRVNYKRRAPSDSEKAEDAIFTGDFLVCIAKQRKFQAQFLRKTAVGLRLINADSKHLCTRLLKSGKPILVCHQLPGSARRVRVNKKSQHDTILSNATGSVLLAAREQRHRSDQDCPPTESTALSRVANFAFRAVPFGAREGCTHRGRPSDPTLQHPCRCAL